MRLKIVNSLLRRGAQAPRNVAAVIIKLLKTSDGQTFKYKKLCLATGGRPKKISDDPRVVVIRDTDSVQDFTERLKHARRIVVVGNGGIATEIVGEVDNVEVIWVIKHESISATFVDAGAARFFLPHLNKEHKRGDPKKRLKHAHHELKSAAKDMSEFGSALGPDWMEDYEITGSLEKRKVHIEYKCSVTEVFSDDICSSRHLILEELPSDFLDLDRWPINVVLSNGKVYGCDFVITAIGVEPNNHVWISPINQFKCASDGGFLVDDQMQTSIADIYAAGDVCTAGWNPEPHWLQMRLWTQARQMGSYAGRCMFSNSSGGRMELDICFELFTHVTKFFGFKVILLGCFNGQKLRDDFEALVRVTSGVEYVKVLVQDGRIHGAVLVGETDLEETLENLILNGIDVESIKADLLNPSIDIEDYFD